MKKSLMSIVGVCLFVAGYHHIHRQSQFTTAQATSSNTLNASKTSTVPPDIQNSLAFKLVRPA